MESSMPVPLPPKPEDYFTPVELTELNALSHEVRPEFVTSALNALVQLRDRHDPYIEMRKLHKVSRKDAALFTLGAVGGFYSAMDAKPVTLVAGSAIAAWYGLKLREHRRVHKLLPDIEPNARHAIIGGYINQLTNHLQSLAQEENL